MAGRELHFLHVFSTFDAGGPQVRTAKILERLLPDHRHAVVAMDGRTGCRERIPDGVAVELLPAPHGGTWTVARAVAGLLRQRQPDALLTYNFGAVEALLGAWLARYRRVVHHEEGFGPEEVDRLFRRRNALRRALLWRARAVVVPSRNLERIAVSTWGQPAARVLYLPNGVDLERFGPGDRPRVDGAQVTVGCVASFRAVKNQALLLRAFAGMEHRERARLLLVGDGPDLEACRALAAELGIAERTVFAGHAEDTASAYHDMDVFAISSRTEQMPIALLEAMSSGLPVVSTDVGDVRDMLAEANRALVVPRDDPAALASALDRLVADVQLRRRLGDANRRRCEERYEQQECLARYARLYEGIARG
jgi:glycosyltransferase involved in cell wall biosynthesis